MPKGLEIEINVTVEMVEGQPYANLGRGPFAWVVGELLKTRYAGHTLVRSGTALVIDGGHALAETGEVLYYHGGVVGDFAGEQAAYQEMVNVIIADRRHA